MGNEDHWLCWAREIQALAQTGHFYARDSFERERAQRLLEIAAEMIAQHTTLSQQEVLVGFTAQEGYITPKVDVRAAIVEDGRLLMVQEALDGGWTLPGGWADVGETPSLAVEREVLEEAGLQVKAKTLVGVYDANRVEDQLALFHAYKLVFLCNRLNGQLSTSTETTQAAFFSLDDLPQPFSGHRTNFRHIEDIRRAADDPNWQTQFD